MDRSQFNPIFTVGHSTHAPEHLAELIVRHRIDVVLDVRSSPYSRRAPQFNRSALKSALRNIGVRYSFGGRHLGGRPDDLSFYVGAQVSYKLMASSESFLASLRRVVRGANSAVVALLCAEADPIECHRFLLLGRALHVRGLSVQHILPNGRLESHLEGECRMLVATGLSQADAFGPAEDALSFAYERQATRYAFVRPVPHHAQRAESA